MNKKIRILDKIICIEEEARSNQYEIFFNTLCLYLRSHDLEYGTNRYNIFNEVYLSGKSSKYYYIIAQENYISTETLYNYIDKINYIAEMLQKNLDELSKYIKIDKQ